VIPVDAGVSQYFGELPTANIKPGDYGWNLVALYGNYQPFGHAGMDFACPIGTPVRAMKDGVVLYAGWGADLPGDNSDWGYRQRYYLYKTFPGIVTVIQHDGWKGVYAHLSTNDQALAGTRVREGQVIALSGNTGGVAAHLHVEALVDDTYAYGIYGRTDPRLYYGGTTIDFAGTVIEAEAETQPEPSQEDTMLVLATNGKDPQVWAGDGLLRRPVWTLDTMSNAQWLAANKVLGPFYKDGEVQTIPDLNAIGIDVMALVGKGVNG
jgi:murein DD-endopeptidase MepM/ murein hydrolase activator NlpD